jgi:ribosomal-protein-alanine N-acetyltransferase
MEIRTAQTEDAPAILQLLRESPGSAQWSTAQVEQAMVRDLVLLACGPSQELQGFAIARRNGPEWELDNIAVGHASRRQGIARALLRELLQRARAGGAGAFFLEVRASNLAARALYEAAGFCQCGTRRTYYRDPQEDAVLYRIGLSSE